MLKVQELQTHRNCHAGSDAVTVQSNSVTDKGQQNFLKGMPQKPDVHSHSKQLETALKRIGKAEVTGQPSLQESGYPAGRRGRMQSRPPYRH